LVKVRLGVETFPCFSTAFPPGISDLSAKGGAYGAPQPWGESSSACATMPGKALIMNDFFWSAASSAFPGPKPRSGNLDEMRRTAAIWRNSDRRFGAAFREVHEECLSFVIPPKHGDPAEGQEDSK
jgi:hypothetical protein